MTKAKMEAKPLEMSKPKPASTVRPSAVAEGTLNGNEESGLNERSTGSGSGIFRAESLFHLRFYCWTPTVVEGTIEAKSS